MQQKPSKETVRVFMQAREKATTPPPSPDEIRRQLGWNMLQGVPTKGTR